MKTWNHEKTAAVCVSALMIVALAACALFENGAGCSSGCTGQIGHGRAPENSDAYAGTYGAFCVCDAKGRSFDLYATCVFREDGCVDLYILKDVRSVTRLIGKTGETEPFMINGVHWFVSEKRLDTRTFFEGIPVGAVYEQNGTLQTIGAADVPSRLIWAKS